jgi:hypothetical protein
MDRDSIAAILVELIVEDRQALFALLAEDGLVNRLGTGAVDNAERDLFIGRATEPLFAELRARIRPEWMAHQGEYDVPEKAGATCTLLVAFKGRDGEEAGFRFIYGSESQGPPGDICDFVTAAVRLTDPWFERQKQLTKAADPPQKPSSRAAAPPREAWWKFW